jgi:hypothetical protein
MPILGGLLTIAVAVIVGGQAAPVDTIVTPDIDCQYAIE